jgi:hypothetical protein
MSSRRFTHVRTQRRMDLGQIIPGTPNRVM